MRDLARKFLSHDCGPFAQFVKYGAVGVMATCVHLAVFYLLASTCLKCLTEDDKAVRLLSLPSAAFTGAEPWYEARWFLAAVATAAGFTVANVFCWLMNRAFVFRPGKFAWHVEFALFYGAAAHPLRRHDDFLRRDPRDRRLVLRKLRHAKVLHIQGMRQTWASYS